MEENMEEEYKKVDIDHVNFAKGLRHLISESEGKLTQKGIAEKAGVSPVNMSRVLSAGFGTTHRWRTLVALAAGAKSAKEIINLGVKLSGKKINEDGIAVDNENETIVPLLSWEEARDWPNRPEIETWIRTIGGHSKNSFALTVRGETMEPEFKEGDTVIIDADIQPVSGMYVIVKTSNGGNGEAAFGQLMRSDTSTILAPINKRYPITDLSNTKFQIIGAVVRKQKTYTGK